MLVGGISQLAQWWRIHLPMQEMQETQGGSLDWEDPLEEEMGNSLKYSGLGNPMDWGA